MPGAPRRRRRPKAEAVMVMDSSCLLGTSSYSATEQHVSVARRWVHGLLSGHVDEGTLFDVALCAAELADNARKHGPASGAISVTVYLCGDVVRLEVANGAMSPTRPHVTGVFTKTTIWISLFGVNSSVMALCCRSFRELTGATSLVRRRRVLPGGCLFAFFCRACRPSSRRGDGRKKAGKEMNRGISWVKRTVFSC
jgi:hypothetical protein